MMSRIRLHKLAGAVFRITQKPVYILHQETWSGITLVILT